MFGPVVSISFIRDWILKPREITRFFLNRNLVSNLILSFHHYNLHYVTERLNLRKKRLSIAIFKAKTTTTTINIGNPCYEKHRGYHKDSNFDHILAS